MRSLEITSLGIEYIDRDGLMLHACFQILKDFVELEVTLDREEKEFRDELMELYAWWLIRSNNSELHIDQDDIDKKMLQRLINIRTKLWT